MIAAPSSLIVRKGCTFVFAIIPSEQHKESGTGDKGYLKTYSKSSSFLLAGITSRPIKSAWLLVQLPQVQDPQNFG